MCVVRIGLVCVSVISAVAKYGALNHYGTFLVLVSMDQVSSGLRLDSVERGSGAGGGASIY